MKAYSRKWWDLAVLFQQTPLRVFLLTLIVNTPSDHCTAQLAPPRPLTTEHKYALSATYTTYRETDITLNYLQSNCPVSSLETSYFNVFCFCSRRYLRAEN